MKSSTEALLFLFVVVTLCWGFIADIRKRQSALKKIDNHMTDQFSRLKQTFRNEIIFSVTRFLSIILEKASPGLSYQIGIFYEKRNSLPMDAKECLSDIFSNLKLLSENKDIDPNKIEKFQDILASIELPNNNIVYGSDITQKHEEQLNNIVSIIRQMDSFGQKSRNFLTSMEELKIEESKNE